MHGHNCLGVFIDCGFYLVRVQVVSDRIDIDEFWTSTNAVNRSCARKECKRAGDNFIARSDAQSEKRQDKSVSSGCAANSETCVAIGGDFRFQFFNLFTQNELLRFEDLVHGFPDLVSNRLVLGYKVDERNGFRGGTR